MSCSYFPKWVVALCLVFFFPMGVQATEIDPQVLKSTQTYLNSIRTLKAHFTQIAPDGSASEGTLWIKRAGKMRWEYAPPTPILMVSSGAFLRYYDKELEQVSDIPLEDSLAGVLAQQNINFDDRSLKVLSANTLNSLQSVRITQRQKPDEGEITFELETSPLKLRRIIMKDAKGEETYIALGNAELNLPLEDSLFTIYDPRMKRKRYQR
jgi:outer membrane lipoprotein-sorting protein